MKKYAYILFLLILLTSHNVCAQAVPDLLYYRFDESGTSIHNWATNPVGNPNGIINGSQQIANNAGLYKGALHCIGGNSSSNHVSTGWQTNLSGSWTIGFWANFTQSSTVQYLFGDSTASGGFSCYSGGNAPAGGLMLTGPFSPIAIYSVAGSPKYVHIVYESHNNRFVVYLNGNAQSNVNTSSFTISAGSDFRIGGYGSQPAFNGFLDEFRVYSRPLSGTEVFQNYRRVANAAVHDVGVQSLMSPNTTDCSVKDVWVKLHNYGSEALFSSIVNWSVNGVVQNPYTFQGNVSAFGGVSNSILIGNYNFNPGDSLLIWATFPNSNLDGFSYNDSLSFFIPNFTEPMVNDSFMFCRGNSANLTVGAPTALYTYRWFNGMTDSAIIVSQPGNYSVTLTELASQCEFVHSIRADEFTPFYIQDTFLICGDSNTLVEGNLDGIYSWSTGDTGKQVVIDQVGNYSVTVYSSDGCVDSSHFYVGILPDVEVDFMYQQSFLYTFTFVNNSINATRYLWDFGDGTTSTQENPMHIFPWPGGCFDVSLLAYNDCDSAVTTKRIKTDEHVSCDTLSIEELYNSFTAKVFPNPSSGKMSLKIESKQQVKLRSVVTDIQGREIYRLPEQSVSNNTIIEPEFVFSSGIYFVQIVANNGERKTLKWIVN